MKRIGLISIFCLATTFSFSDSKITRGPNIGEIYFIGPTNTGLGLYHSTDFGETAICVDNTFSSNIMSICADKTPGVIYYVTMQEGLYISYDYGNISTWELRNGGVKIQINSGLIEGEIYSSFSKHSEDYGINFITHSYNGFFGSKLDVEIDNEENIGYVLVNKYGVLDSVYLLISYDKFENLILSNSFNLNENPIGHLRRGVEFGELYTSFQLYSDNFRQIKHSFDYGQNWTLINKINSPYFYNESFTGGRQPGELYLLISFVNMAWLNAHIYILHSTDYGNTFQVYHPFAKGNEPVLANFSTFEKEIQLTTPVMFSNFSIGDIIEYQWDFENDGTIDSYDEFPTHIYQDTGYYSVKLSVVGQDSTNTFIKENYIHVIDTITSTSELKYQKVNIFPNPFNNKITIGTNSDFEMIEIYDLNGKIHYSKTLLRENNNERIDLKELEKGIYILKLKTEEQYITKKIIKI